MPLDLAATGASVGPLPHAVGWRDTVLYALAVGETDLDYLYEGRGPKIVPGYWTALAFRACGPLLERTGAPEESALFGGCTLAVTDAGLAARPGDVFVHGQVEGVYATGPLGVVGFRFAFTDSAGAALAAVRFEVYYPGLGAEGAPRAPRTPRVLPPPRTPDWSIDVPTSPQQALLYRLCGDLNPLHADPSVAAANPDVTRGRPILHGLCTFGLVACAAQRASGSQLRGLSARFARPAWPGDTLAIHGWTTDRGATLRVRTAADPEDDVLTAATADLAPPGVSAR